MELTDVSPTCGAHFLAWQRRLEIEPGIWSLRDVPGGRLWRCARLREWLGNDQEVMPWRESLLVTPALEDAISRALKCQTVEVLQLRPAAPHAGKVEVRLFASRCKGCARRCACVILRSCLMEKAADGFSLLPGVFHPEG